MCSSVSPSITVPRCWAATRSEEHTSELQSQSNLVCRLLLEKKKILLDAIWEDHIDEAQLQPKEVHGCLPVLSSPSGCRAAHRVLLGRPLDLLSLRIFLWSL